MRKCLQPAYPGIQTGQITSLHPPEPHWTNEATKELQRQPPSAQTCWNQHCLSHHVSDQLWSSLCWNSTCPANSAGLSTRTREQLWWTQALNLGREWEQQPLLCSKRSKQEQSNCGVRIASLSQRCQLLLQDLHCSKVGSISKKN